MVSLSKFTGLVLVPLCMGLICCSFPVRTGYDRNIGDYKPVPASEVSTRQAASPPPETAPQPAAQNANVAALDSTKKPQNSAEKARAAINKKETAKAAAKSTPRGSFESYARQWLGAKYGYAMATKTKTDCSGYVMQVYKGFYGISLDHNAQRIFDDGRGYSIKRKKLQEGDLVFFGNFWKISHVGIYLKGDRFIHASTSNGVVITPMDDNYWASKYKGARRFK